MLRDLQARYLNKVIGGISVFGGGNPSVANSATDLFSDQNDGWTSLFADISGWSGRLGNSFFGSGIFLKSLASFTLTIGNR